LVFGGILVASSSSLAIAAGCSSSSGGGTAPGDSPLVCPASIALAIGAACTHEGQDCPIGYACGAFPQQSHCVCTKGKFVCTDATGADVPKGAQPQCVGLAPPNSKECPAAESGTDGKTCHTSGLLCYYTGVQCPENATPFTDECQCIGSLSSDSGLAFHCEPKTCNPRSDASDDAFSPPDTGPGDSGRDG
jgi:hypothetical protein